MKTARVISVLIFMASMAEGGQLLDSRAPDFSLLDQRDRPVSLQQMKEQVVVLIASDNEGSKQNSGWKKALDKYGTRIYVLGVADVRKVPFFLKSKFKRDFQKDPAAILLDWEGVIFSAYGLKQGVPNIILIDKKGILRYLHSGQAEQAAVERFYRELDKTLD
jgi:predicted transcriptional regulator